jgi:serine phosphatase RsbU (regulator of sigma subunit)/CHASE2 domain-containing sensor protein
VTLFKAATSSIGRTTIAGARHLARLSRVLGSGWGRRAGWLTLIVFTILQLVAGGVFTTPRLALFDLYQRKMPRHWESGPVVIVGIDNKSLAEKGQWPWPRQLDAQLVKKIVAGHPAALGIDLVWSEPDSLSPERVLGQEGDIPPAIRSALSQLPSHDDLLRNALASGPIAIGVGGIDIPTDPAQRLPAARGPWTPFRSFAHGTDPKMLVPRYFGALRSIPELDNAGDNLGHGFLSVTADPDGVYRRMPMVSSVAQTLVPGLALEMLRLAANAQAVTLYSEKTRIQGVAVGPLDIPTQADGSLWINFTNHRDARFVSAADVLDGTLPPDIFDQRLVLIGVNGLGEDRDQRLTPLGQMPGTEIQAQILENILDGRVVTRPSWTGIVETALTLVFGLILIAVLPLLHLRWQGPFALVVIALLAAVGAGFWHQQLMLIDVATPMIGQGLLVAAFVSGSFAEADRQRRRLRRELEDRKLTAARTEGELEAARRIQMGILPTADSVSHDQRFDLAAVLVPARQIGGDLYDFFMIDDDRLFLEVGDVSGKGVPAALFMAQGKSLCKSAALRGDIDIGEIINRANAEISRDNSEMLFITMFASILNLATGELHFCNAGHDAPILLRTGERPQSVDGDGGPPLCIIEDFPYRTEVRQLQPGDLLCITTDGISEAMNGSGALMGRTHAEAILGAMPDDASAAAITDGLLAAVAEFVAGAEPSDDLTILTVRWLGPRAVWD